LAHEMLGAAWLWRPKLGGHLGKDTSGLIQVRMQWLLCLFCRRLRLQFRLATAGGVAAALLAGSGAGGGGAGGTRGARVVATSVGCASNSS